MKWLLAAVGLALALLVLGAAWLLGTEPGLRWSAARLAEATGGKLSLSGLRGALAADVAFGEIRFRDGATDIRLANGELRLELLALLGGRAGLRSLRAERLEITPGEGRGQPATRPSLPLGLRIQSARIALIRYRDFTMEDFELTGLALREQGSIAGSASFELRETPYPARVRLQLGGTLERIEATASASVAEIPVSARALLAPFAERPLQALDARAGPADLSRLQPAWPRSALTLELSGKAGPAEALAGRLALRNAQPGTLDKQRLPLATLDSRFATDFASLSLRELRITGAGTLSGEAQLAPRRARLELRAAGFDLRAVHSTLRQTRLSGPLTIVATEQSQLAQGTLSQDGISLAAEAVRTGDVVEIRRLRATAEGSEVAGSGRLRLGEPLGFEARLQLAGFDPARFGDYPAGDINGTVQASGALSPSFAVDARWTVADSRLLGEPLASSGRARFVRHRVSGASAEAVFGTARLSARGAFGRPGDELALQLDVPELAEFMEGSSGRVSVSARLSGTWETPRGSVQAKASALSLPNGMLLEAVTAQADGTLVKHDVEASARGEGLDLSARLRGGWRGKAGWSGELYALRNTGAYPLQLAEPASLSIAPARVELGRLRAKLGAGSLLVRQLSWSPERLASSGEVRGLPAQWLVLATGLADRVRASLLLDGRWDLAAAPRLDGTLELRRSSGDIAVLPDELALELERLELEARFTDGAANASAALASKYGVAEAQANLRGFAADAPLDFTARMRFAELRTLLQPFLNDARVEGRVAAEVRGSGTLARVSLSGSARGEALALQIPPYGVFLRDGELRAELQNDQLRITDFSIAGSGGRLTASGTLPLRGGDAAHVDWRAESFGLLARPDLRLAVSGAGQARLAEGKVSLSGALRAERGYIELEQERLPQLGDDVVIAGTTRAAPRERARLPIGLEVQLDLGERLEVRGYGLEGRLTGKLQVETTKDGELRMYGRIQTVNATFLAYGQRLQVDPGIAIFDGPLDNPALQLTAWRRNQQVEAGVQISGTARAPRVQLVSQPPVPEGERLSWLVLGRAPGEATKADLGLLQAAAGALLARGDQMPLDRRIARAFGLDEISLRGSGEVGDRVVAVGKRLSDRLYVSYEQGLGVVASSLVKLDLALTQRLSVRTETGTSSGVGLFYRFSWD
jgi:translocation and assembly module TamB